MKPRNNMDAVSVLSRKGSPELIWKMSLYVPGKEVQN
jgi:hypothetical protein